MCLVSFLSAAAAASRGGAAATDTGKPGNSNIIPAKAAKTRDLIVISNPFAGTIGR
jgi:hypothetical protein